MYLSCLQVNGHRFACHRAVLASRSRYFERLLRAPESSSSADGGCGSDESPEPSLESVHPLPASPSPQPVFALAATQTSAELELDIGEIAGATHWLLVAQALQFLYGGRCDLLAPDSSQRTTFVLQVCCLKRVKVN